MQQETLGHHGRSGDPPDGIRNILRSGQERLTDRQRGRLAQALAADERHDEVHIAWQVAQQLRSPFHRDARPRVAGSPSTSSRCHQP